ncbi:hypothetical protein GCM10009730_38870 [Streptomyces albidochromogenes]
MRTSMAMAFDSCQEGGVKGARQFVPRAGASVYVCWLARGSGRRRTDGAGEPAQVDVQARHEQHGARRRLTHVVGNHAVIV